MKKISLLLFFIFSIVCLTVPAYAEAEKSILIKTIDNTEAIEKFKENLGRNGSMLTNNGFGKNSQIGTPFSFVFQDGWDPSMDQASPDGKNFYLFYFPIINDGKIVNYVEQHVLNDGTILWNVGEFFDGKRNLEQLGDGNAYALIEDKTGYNQLAVSDSKTINFSLYPDYCPIDCDTPYEGIETKVVNILEPIDIDTSALTFQTDEENAIFENARAKGKHIKVETAETLKTINKDNRLLIPLRDIAEAIDCTVEWDSSEKAVYVSKNGSTVKFVIGSANYIIDNKANTLDVPAEIIDGKTYIPFRAAGEALGIGIAYNPTSKNITFSY